MSIMGDGVMILDGLCECLRMTEDVDLLGMRLMQAYPLSHLGAQQIPREQLKEAVIEVIDYTTRCQQVADRLRQLEPIALTSVIVWGYDL